MTHYQLKYQCIYCNTAFIVMTNIIRPYHADGTHCPDCGATGTSLRHDSVVEGQIEDVVPGDTPLSHVGKHIEEQLEDGELQAYALKEDVHRQLDQHSLQFGLQELLPRDLQSLADAVKRGDI